MIFKVLQADTDKWFYYDNIRLFKHKREVRELNEPIGEHVIILLLSDRDPANLINICDLNFENGDCLTVIFEEDAYLLNDEGKTVERIN